MLVSIIVIYYWLWVWWVWCDNNRERQLGEIFVCCLLVDIVLVYWDVVVYVLVLLLSGVGE